MMFILSLVGATTLAGALKVETVNRHELAVEVANVAFEHPLGEWVEPEDVPQVDTMTVDTLTVETLDVEPWTQEAELEYKNLYLEMEEQARKVAQVERFRELMREDYHMDVPILPVIEDDVQQQQHQGTHGLPEDFLKLVEAQAGEFEAKQAAAIEAKASELAVARELQQKRRQALEMHGWQPALIPPAGPAAELVIGSTTSSPSLVAPPSSVVETNGEFVFEDSAGQRRRLAQYMPTAPSNCNSNSSCHQGQYHSFGGSGGGSCPACSRFDGSPCTSRIRKFMISGSNLITGMRTYFKDSLDNNLGDVVSSSMMSTCGSAETKFHWGTTWYGAYYAYWAPVWNELDVSDWSCITAVKGRSGVYLDGLQFVGYKQNGQNNYQVKTSQWFGGQGGSYWEAHAPQGKCLTGMKFKSGNKIDKIYLNFGGYYNKQGQSFNSGR